MPGGCCATSSQNDRWPHQLVAPPRGKLEVSSAQCLCSGRQQFATRACARTATMAHAYAARLASIPTMMTGYSPMHPVPGSAPRRCQGVDGNYVCDHYMYCFTAAFSATVHDVVDNCCGACFVYVGSLVVVFPCMWSEKYKENKKDILSLDSQTKERPSSADQNLCMQHITPSVKNVVLKRTIRICPGRSN